MVTWVRVAAMAHAGLRASVFFFQWHLPLLGGAPWRATAQSACLAFAGLWLAACATVPEAAGPAADAPDAHFVRASGPVDAPATYREALSAWHNADDVSAWIGAHFRYDMARAMQLSETQRHKSARMPIHAPEAFFDAPNGVCVDLARFAVETLRAIDKELEPSYLMIEFKPVSMAGNTLRRHWLASFQRGGMHYFFADSKRPGHIAGPYAGREEFIAEYARYRGREIVAFRSMESYERSSRRVAAKRSRELGGQAEP